MTREAFIERLRLGLRGLPEPAVGEIIADYQAHFADGAAAGRSDADIAAGLGDPDRLARELRAEVGLKRWEEQRSPEAGAAAVFAVLGLGALDLIFLLPVLIGVVSVLFGLMILQVVVFVAGAAVFAGGPFTHSPTNIAAVMLSGLGLMAMAVCVGTVLSLISIGLVNALVWYGRLHYRLLKPAIDPPSAPRREIAAT